MIARWLSEREAIALLRGGGWLSDDSPLPELNPRVLAAYAALERDWCGPRAPLPVLMVGGRYAFAADPHDLARPGFNLAFGGCMVDPCLPVSRALFHREAAAIAAAVAALGVTVLTDTFRCPDGYPPAPGPHLLALHSPVARLDGADWSASLTRHRRSNLNRLQRRFPAGRFRFDLSAEPLREAELSAAVEHLCTRWGAADWPYALVQTLWSQAVAAVLPDQALFLRVFDRGDWVFTQTLLRRHGGVFAQSVFKHEQRFQDGIAAATDAAAIRALAGGDARFFDPSCRTGWDDPPAIGIAKRATVNADQVKPLFAAGPGLPAEVRAVLAAGQPLGRPAC